jgi:hypothetical protein
MGDCNCYANGVAILDDEPRNDRDLAMRLGYEVATEGALNELLNRLSQYKPVYLKAPIISLAALAFFLLTVYSIASLVRISSSEAPSPRPGQGQRAASSSSTGYVK